MRRKLPEKELRQRVYTSELVLGIFTVLDFSFLFCKMKAEGPMISSLLHLPIQQITTELLMHARPEGTTMTKKTRSCSRGACVLWP